jgi:hypothetical protein
VSWRRKKAIGSAQILRGRINILAGVSSLVQGRENFIFSD